MRNPGSKPEPLRSRREILNVLKAEGPSDSTFIAQRIGISAMAVRQHLYELERHKLVTYQEETRPVGRPAKIWRLKPAAEGFFPDSHSELAGDLIEGVHEFFGEQGLRMVLSVFGRRQLDYLRKRAPLRGSSEAKLKALATIRSRQGFLTKLEKSKDGSFLLTCSHCPIRSAAGASPLICDHELGNLRALAGAGLDVERTECMTSGGRRCVYRVKVRS